MQQIILPKQPPFHAVYSVFGMLCLGVLVINVGSLGYLISAICWPSEASGVPSSTEGEAWGAHSKSELHHRSILCQDFSSLSIGCSECLHTKVMVDPFVAAGLRI